MATSKKNTKEEKEKKRFDVSTIRLKNNVPVSLRLDEETYLRFKKVMSEQELNVSQVINEFMHLVNDLLINKGSGEVCFIFEEKKEGGKS